MPWQLLCEEKGAALRVTPIDDTSTVATSGVRAPPHAAPRIVSVAHVSNALGTVNPVRRMSRAAHAAGRW
ncbi:MAG: aminotransferase class V-fold PLP-dependent enzyme [Vicinamibacteria bacterium]